MCAGLVRAAELQRCRVHDCGSHGVLDCTEPDEAAGRGRLLLEGCELEGNAGHGVEARGAAGDVLFRKMMMMSNTSSSF